MRRDARTSGLCGPGSDLLSRALRHSTIGAEGFHGRVRDGIGCWGPRYGHQVDEAHSCDCDAAGETVSAGRLPLRAVGGGAG